MNKKIEIAKKRAFFLRNVRDFFLRNNYLEVETPILSPFLLPEPAIEAFQTEYSDGYGDKSFFYLIPSPEIWMKRLVAQGFSNIFQITKCFRNGETQGVLHNPEFTMCEWYSMDADYMDSVRFTEEFFNYLLRNSEFEIPIDIRPPFLRISMKEAFWEYLHVDLDALLPDPRSHQLCEELDISITDSSTEEEVFNKLFLTYVEPQLPKNKPVVLYDYPVCMPVPAKKDPSGLYYERWELYIAGIEIANCYTEEIDRENIETFIHNESERKKNAFVVPAVDKEFTAIFTSSYPPCSGVALGIDRLFMIITGINSIEGVILFPFSCILHR
ncbi:MAG: hypothetical protein JXJ04_03615 [Spirochaetales bacterium]|nr:hypothetical protein [Spirochaetales bacterium]